MQVSQKGLDLIKFYESFRDKAYQDSVGIWTIGYGTTVYSTGKKVQPGESISESAALNELAFHINHNIVPQLSVYVKAPLNQEQFDALVCFAYNVGSGALATSTLLRKLNNGDVEGAQAQFLVWNKAGGQVLRGLTRRRLSEATLFGPKDRDYLIKTYLGGIDPNK
jgi:lysozyme